MTANINEFVLVSLSPSAQDLPKANLGVVAMVSITLVVNFKVELKGLLEVKCLATLLKCKFV